MCWGPLHCTLALCFWATLQKKISNKGHKYAKEKKRYLIYCEEDDCLLKTETRRLCSPSARNTSVRKLNSALSVNDDESVTSLDLGSQISVNEWPAQISPAGMAPCPAQPLWVGPVSFGRSQQSHPLCEDLEPGPRQGLQKDTQVTPHPRLFIMNWGHGDKAHK